MNKYLRFIFQPPISKNFMGKLKSNFHVLTPLEMIIYFVFLAPFWSKDKRFFFQGSLLLKGQMYLLERKALYDIIVNEKPRQCYEIGTFTGGGSTFFLSSALQKNGNGTLLTMENDTKLYEKARKYYKDKLSGLNNHINFIFGERPEEFDKYIPEDKKVDCVFFDGAENSQQTLDQYHYFKPFFKPGSVIMFHDWNTEKTAAIRPVIETDTHWSKITELTPPDSIGFAAFRYV